MNIKELLRIGIVSNTLKLFSKVFGYMMINAGDLQIKNVII